MSTFTIAQDKAVRVHLAALAREIRAKFQTTAYQGDYVNTVTDETFGDRLQVGTQVTIDSTRYLLVANVLVSRNTGGRVAVRVSAWSLSGNTGKPVGTWVIRRTTLNGVTLTDKGFRRRIGNTYAPVDMVQRLTSFLNLAKTSLRTGFYGRPVVEIRTDRYGQNPYSTLESHLLVFGGTGGVTEKLMR